MKPIDPQVIEELRRCVQAYNLDKKAQEAVESYLAEDPEVFPPEIERDIRNLQLKLKYRGLYFENTEIRQSYVPYIKSHYILTCRDIRVGYYDLISHLDGSSVDDYLVFEKLS